MKVNFYPIDIDHIIEDNQSYIILFGRDENKERLCIKIPFDPYIWINPKNKNKKEITDILNLHKEEFKIISIDEEERGFKAKIDTFLKVTVQTPEIVPKLRDFLSVNKINFLEADILYTRRYIIDNEIIFFQEYIVEGESTSPLARSRCMIAKSFELGEKSYEDNARILSIDIETYPDESKSTENAILMAAFYAKDFQKVITWKQIISSVDYIERVNSESELIERIKEIITEYNPDVITGYSSDYFDFPFINARAQKYKIKLDIGIDHSVLHFGKGRRSDAKITGIVHFDVYNLTKNILAQSLKTDTLKLDDVANELLGERKKDLNILDLARAWDENDTEMLKEFCAYNLQDARITEMLCSKLLPNLIEMVRIVGLSPYDVSRLPMSQMVEWFLIKNAAKKKILIPNKPDYNEIRERSIKRLQGAFVYKPEPGLYKDILLFDFRSIYPTIIASHNLSGETLNCQCCKLTGSRVPIEGKEMWFCQKKKGFLPQMIEELITRRMRVKEIMKEQSSAFLEARQQGLKLLANSFYGYLAFDISRWYSFEAANATTAYARHYIKMSIKRMQDAGFKVIYSDTDSIFVTVSKDQNKEEALNIAKAINKELPGLMELEFEGHYTAGIFVSAKEGSGGAKKRYALIDDNDKMTIKGFESIRRNTSIIAKEAQRKVLGIILKEHNREKAISYIKDLIEKIKNSEIEVEKFLIKTRLSRDLEGYESIGPHVKIAKEMKEKGIKIGMGSVISYVICSGKGIIRDKAKLLADARKEDIDREYYINNQIIPAVEKIFEVLSYDVKEIIEKKKQHKLDQFF